MSRRINVGVVRNLILTRIPLTQEVKEYTAESHFGYLTGDTFGHVNARTTFVMG